MRFLGKGVIKLYIIIVLITSKMTSNEKGIRAPQKKTLKRYRWLFPGSKGLKYLLWEKNKCTGQFCKRHLYELCFGVSRGQKGSERMGEQLFFRLEFFYLLPSSRMKLTGILVSAPRGQEVLSVSLGCWSLGVAPKGNTYRLPESELWKTLERIWCLERPCVFLEWAWRGSLNMKQPEDWSPENRHRQMQGAPGASRHNSIFAFGKRYNLGVCVSVVGFWPEFAFLGNLA